MSYYIPQWDNEHLEPLEEVLRECLIHAERYGDSFMILHMKLLLNLIFARKKSIAVEV